MNSEIQSLLKSPLPADRKRGLQMLAKSDDPQDLKVLSALHKRETDPELKQLIVQVGKTVKQRVDAASTSSAPVSKTASSMPKPMNKAAISTGGGSNQAAALMEQAQEALIELDFDNAKALARKAFTLNPDLQHDEDARNLAGDIFATSADEAVAQLLGKSVGSADVLDWVDGVSSVDRGKPKRKSKGEQADVTWGTALLDVGLYGLFSGAITFLMMLFIIYVMGNAMQSLYNLPELRPEDAFMLDQFLAAFGTIGLGVAVLYSVITAVSAIIQYFIWFGVVHIVSTMILNGRGTFSGLLHQVSIPMIVAMVISGLLSIGYVYYMVSVMEQALMNPTPGQGIAYNGATGLFYVVMIILSLGFSFWLSATIGSNYDFGTGRGCVSLIVSYIVLTIIACGCISFMTFALGNSISAYSSFIPLFY
jgi:hypothetical protein